MKIIISPAKKMKRDTDTFTDLDIPVFLPETKRLADRIRAMSYEEVKTLWGCNDIIANENFERFRDMELERNLTPSILSYDGIQYTYMAPNVFENGEFDYVQQHLRILSGFYGVLKPMDGVVLYRLEMQAPLEIDQTSGLYDFWGDKLYREVMDESRTVINLASKEYSKAIKKYLIPKDRFITCEFMENTGDKLLQKGVYVKMARGEMVRFMAERNVKDPEELKKFERGGYSFAPERSDDATFVFVR